MLRERRAAGDRGAAAVEFALVMPVLLLLIFGIIQYGYSLFQVQAAQATIAQAARQAAVGLNSCGQWRAVVADSAGGNGMTLTAAEISGASLQWFRQPFGAAAPAPVDTPQPGDFVTATLTFEPSLDLPLVPFPETVSRESTTSVQGVGDITTGC